MIPELRSQFNTNFSEEVYNKVVDGIEKDYAYRPTFKIAETPIFIDKALKAKLIEACEEITDSNISGDSITSTIQQDAIDCNQLESSNGL